MKRLFDKKTSDQTTRGLDLDQVKNWLNGVKDVESLKYYYYAPGSKFPTESRTLKAQSVADAVSFLTGHFMESPNSFVEVQRKVFSSNRQEIIFREINSNGEIIKIGVLQAKKT